MAFSLAMNHFPQRKFLKSHANGGVDLAIMFLSHLGEAPHIQWRNLLFNIFEFTPTFSCTYWF